MDVTKLRYDHVRLLHEVLDFYVGNDNFDLEMIQELYINIMRLTPYYQDLATKDPSFKTEGLTRSRRLVAEILIEAGLQEFLFSSMIAIASEQVTDDVLSSLDNDVQSQVKKLTKMYPKSHTQFFAQPVLKHLTHAKFLREHARDAGIRRNDEAWLSQTIQIWEALSIELLGVDLASTAEIQAKKMFDSPEALLLLSSGGEMSPSN